MASLVRSLLFRIRLPFGRLCTNLARRWARLLILYLVFCCWLWNTNYRANYGWLLNTRTVEVRGKKGEIGSVPYIPKWLTVFTGDHNAVSKKRTTFPRPVGFHRTATNSYARTRGGGGTNASILPNQDAREPIPNSGVEETAHEAYTQIGREAATSVAGGGGLR